MKITELLSAQLDREAPVSRRVLERVPEGRPDWKPHERSMPLGYVATLVATMPSWIAMVIGQVPSAERRATGSRSEGSDAGT